jgi:predicted Zn-dependent protease
MAWEAVFTEISNRLLEQLQGREALSLELVGENSQFIRFNRARVRQTGVVRDCRLKLTLISEQRVTYRDFPLTGDWATDWATALENLGELRQEIPQLPEDPFIVFPSNQGSTHEVYSGGLLAPERVVEEILEPVQVLDLTGFYSGGVMVRAHHNSAGQKHWFSTESFFLDYSLINAASKAVKRILADRTWQADHYHAQISEAKHQLELLAKPIYSVKPGRYRTYLAPAATGDLIGMFSWGAISEASLRQGGSALAKMREGKNLSPLFNLAENFQGGTTPRFNDLGELAPATLSLITEGQLVNTLVSSRTAKEYGLVGNGASRREGLRSPEVGAGSLALGDILTALDTGLYLGNLHYLNWSDRPSGRITGMTRYACFWVERGEIVAPIQDLRFDESLYAFLGENLLALTDFRELIPETDTYEFRSLGGQLLPGLLVDNFTFTL